MSFEESSWAKLSPEQAGFFTGQILAATQIAFSPTAHQAGIMPLNAGQLSFRTGNEDLSAISWPDQYAPNTFCMVMGSGSRNSLGGSAFVRVMEALDGYSTEGVSIHPTSGPASCLYGRQLISRHVLGDTPPPALGLGFFAASKQQSIALARLDYMPRPADIIETVGIEGATTARLFRSLSSLGSNLIVAGTLAEKTGFSDQTYDLAQTLLKLKLAAVDRQKPSEGAVLLHGPNGMPKGMAFESEQDGIVVVRQVDGFPTSIVITTASRPKVDQDAVFLEQYLIQSRAVVRDATVLAPEAYNLQTIVSSLAIFNSSKERLEFTESERRDLESRIVRLMTEQTNQPTV